LKITVSILLSILLYSCSKREELNITPAIFTTKEYEIQNQSSKIVFLDSLSKDIEELPIDTTSINFLFDLSTEYYFLNENSKSLLVSFNALERSNKISDTLSIAKSYNYIGDAYEQEYKDSAYFYYQKAEKLYQLLGNDELRAKMLFNKSYILFFEGNYVESEILLSNALQLLKSKSNHELKYTILNLMGCNLEKLDDYDNSLKYFGLAEKELFILNKQDVNFNQKFNYNVVLSINKANVYDKKKEYTKSIQELNTVLNNDIAKKWPMNFAIALGNLGYSKMKKGDLNIVEPIMIKSLKLSLKHNNQSDVANKLINLGEYYLIKKDTTKSRDYLNRALVLGHKIKASNELKLVYDLLSKAEPQRDSYYKGKIIRLTDSLAVVQRKNRNKYARIEYETAVVEDANKELSSKNLYLIVGVVVLVGALGVRYVMGQRKEIAYRKRLQVAEQELFDLMQTSQIELNGAREEEQNRISRELHDNVMNKLYGTRLHLGLLNTSTSPDAQEKRSEHIDELQTIENEIRSISHDLHTDSVASHFDYPVLLATCVQKAGGNGNTLFAFESAPEIDWDSISGLIKITIYRIVQEALFNVTKYADATECTITLSHPEPTGLLLTISDNGKGFDSTSSTTGIGLANMKERARLVKADLQIQSVPGQGTTIECKFVV
jgi:signal transduction histidine kinase